LELMASLIRCLVSAGPTREYFDPVRFISNPSTGRMGFALARAAAATGWETTLVTGPAGFDDPPETQVFHVESAEEMHRALGLRFSECDVLIMAAAVSDCRPRRRAPGKVKKGDMEMCVELEPTPDILKTLGERRRPDQLLVGFAAETDRLEAEGRRKLMEKRCDVIVANRVGVPGSGFGAADNAVIVLTRSGAPQRMGPAPKDELARQLIACFSTMISKEQRA